MGVLNGELDGDSNAANNADVRLHDVLATLGGAVHVADEVAAVLGVVQEHIRIDELELVDLDVLLVAVSELDEHLGGALDEANLGPLVGVLQAT